MSEDSMLKCLIAFVLGYLVAHMMRGNGLMVGGQNVTCNFDENKWKDSCIDYNKEESNPPKICKDQMSMMKKQCINNIGGFGNKCLSRVQDSIPNIKNGKHKRFCTEV
jgi:hypothetical protein